MILGLVAQVRLASLVENSFNAVERVSEYGKLAEEAAAHIEGSHPRGWPSRGEVRKMATKLSFAHSGSAEASAADIGPPDSQVEPSKWNGRACRSTSRTSRCGTGRGCRWCCGV